MTSTAPTKAYALPRSVAERRANMRNASRTMHTKSRDASCSLDFSLCVFCIMPFLTSHAIWRTRAHKIDNRAGGARREAGIDFPGGLRKTNRSGSCST